MSFRCSRWPRVRVSPYPSLPAPAPSKSGLGPLKPQHFSRPSRYTAHVCSMPASTCTMACAVGMMRIGLGTDKGCCPAPPTAQLAAWPCSEFTLTDALSAIPTRAPSVMARDASSQRVLCSAGDGDSSRCKGTCSTARTGCCGSVQDRGDQVACGHENAVPGRDGSTGCPAAKPAPQTCSGSSTCHAEPRHTCTPLQASRGSSSPRRHAS